ncbi:MAG: hypothetical protein HUU16_15295 [Candidatus Omnitrophica bacterium]|nr:hypothetical protein [bacterium]NUN97527.1 hypothetical protein [Candidatus Omnitrophota bacterium]
MRFSDLLPGFTPKVVGRVIEAEWDAAEGGIRFIIRFDPSGRLLHGVCRAGSDPRTGSFLSESELRSKLPRFRDLVLHEHPTGGDPNTLSTEEFRKLSIEFSLSTFSLGYRPTQPPVSVNSLLSRALRD